MKKGFLVFVFAFITSIGFSQKGHIATGQYETRKTYDEVFLAILKNVPLYSFQVKNADKELGTITASKLGIGTAAEYASIFFMIKKNENGVVVDATFRRNPGFMGGGKPDQWAKDFGEKYLRQDIEDLLITVIKR